MKKQKLIALDDAVILLNEAWGLPANSRRNVASKKTIYNAISLKRIKRYGPKKLVMVSVDEILSVWGPEKSA